MSEEKIFKELERNMGLEFIKSTKINKECVKEMVADVVNKTLADNGIKIMDEKKDIDAKTLWETMSVFEKFQWYLLSKWPLKIIAERKRNNIDLINRSRWLEHSGGFCPNLIEYPKIFSPNPKAYIIFNIKMKTQPIEQVMVTGEISV